MLIEKNNNNNNNPFYHPLMLKMNLKFEADEDFGNNSPSDGSVEEKDLKRPDLKGTYPCSLCSKVFCHSSSLSRHRMQIHFSHYHCTICNKEIKIIGARIRFPNCDHQELDKQMGILTKESNHRPVAFDQSTSQLSRTKEISQLIPTETRRYSFCREPYYLDRLPEILKTQIKSIWALYRNGENCEMEVARTRNLVSSLSTKARMSLFGNLSAPCRPPPILANLPRKTQRKIAALWRSRDPNKGCGWQKQKTRFILLNLSSKHRPPPFRCEMPHFVHRLESTLQRAIQRIWLGYREGAPCHDQIDRQLSLLQSNEISLGSFRYPPPEAFKRIDRLKKFRHEK
ncbi:unnamed protein product, partial [Mesorhabditis belari]|uniref:C2H2-type domain-containing protein n=1 Tax=Mesorhabditis belari TaxID=2138241 RepID=A0AAF3FEW7_9BILA